MVCDGFRREIGGQGANLVDTVDVLGHVPEIDQALLEQHVHDRE